MLGVYILDAFEIEVSAELGEGRVGSDGEEGFEAGGEGWGLEGVVVGENLGDDGEFGGGDG